MNFSITNWVEIIKIDSLSRGNLFDMIRYEDPANTIRKSVCSFNISDVNYNAYKVTNIYSNRFQLMPTMYDQTITRKTTYIFINKSINRTREQLQIDMFNLWLTKSGTERMGSIQFPISTIRFPLIMPSRVLYPR